LEDNNTIKMKLKEIETSNNLEKENLNNKIKEVI
jgi:hypothetical protein